MFERESKREKTLDAARVKDGMSHQAQTKPSKQQPTTSNQEDLINQVTDEFFNTIKSTSETTSEQK